MSVSVAVPSNDAVNPLAEYVERRNHFQAVLRLLDRRIGWLGNVRFVLVMASGILLAIGSFERAVSSWTAAVPFGIFLATAPWAHRLSLRRHRSILNHRFYQLGIDRMEDRWMGNGASGSEFADEDHLYSQDLDLFGRGSLFERLCIATTEVGRRTLARWLSEPASVEEILLRHEAIRELREGFHRHEHLDSARVSAKPIHTDALMEWSRQGNIHRSQYGRVLAPLLLLITALTLFGWVAEWFGVVPVIAALLSQGAFAVWASPRVAAALSGLDRRSEDVVQLASRLIALERKSFRSKKLESLRVSLNDGDARPSEQLAELVRYLGRLELTRNPFLGLAATFLLWRTQVGLAIEAWRSRTGTKLIDWLEALGEIEALNSLAAYSYENPGDPFPTIETAETRIRAVGLSHPLLPRAQSIPNDLTLDLREPLLIVSGSNMSGKSTYLRTIGVNVVLALAGAPVRAASMTVCRMNIGTSLRTHDSLQTGKSRFYAEITRLRKIVDRTRDALPVLFLLDEILNGTNSHDRRIGAEAIVRLLLSKQAIGLITTHDLALTTLADHLGASARNVHFQDELRDGELYFDYRLKPGIVQHSNALALMRAVGLLEDRGSEWQSPPILDR